MKKQIEIDIEVHRYIESARIDFKESQNTILRRLLGIDRDQELQSPDIYDQGTEMSDLTSDNANYYNLANEISSYQDYILNKRIRSKDQNAARDWIYRGARLREGARLRKWSSNQKIEAIINNGSIFINGEYYKSPSAAAMAVNGGINVNGWMFWEYFDESSMSWEKLSELRKNNPDK
jgi:hypothetical protein